MTGYMGGSRTVTLTMYMLLYTIAINIEYNCELCL